MAHDVHLHVAFNCDSNEGVAALARKHLPAVQEVTRVEGRGPAFWDPAEAVWFLTDLSERTGSNPGPKGGLSLWGIVGNHTRAEVFAAVLRAFWDDLLRLEVDGGPQPWAHIIILYEEEQSEQANALEIYLTGDIWNDRANCSLTISKHEGLPFAWMQK
jgi:hypothetical protein